MRFSQVFESTGKSRNVLYKASPGRHRRAARPLHVEPLEQRTLLSVGLYAGDQGTWLDFDTADGPDLGVPAKVELTSVSDAGVTGQVSVSGAWLDSVMLDGAKFDRLTIPDSGYTGAIGEPQLPLVRTLLVAPEGAEVTARLTGASEIVSVSAAGIDDPLAPLQSSVPKLAGALEAAPLDFSNIVYETDTFGPATGIRVSEAGYLAGQRLVMLEIAPVAYNPVQEALTICDTLTFDVSFQGGEPYRNVGAAGPVLSAAEDSRLAEVSLNHQALQAAAASGRLLIVAHDSFVAGMAPYVAHKTGLGWAVDLVDTSTAGTTNTDIRAFIAGRYADPGTRPDALLLVGDTAQIPHFVGSGTGTPHTDLYYGCMDGGDDWYPEFPVGRFSVTNTTQLGDVIDKTITYETSSSGDWTTHAVFMASVDNYQVSEGTHNWVIDNYLDPAGYTSDKLYQVTYGATTQDVRDSFNDGRAMGIYSGHGSTYSWADGPPFSQADVRNLTNAGMYPLVASFACITGTYTAGECFMETWLRTPDSGAVVAVGSSVNSYWTEDDVLEKALFTATYDQGYSRIGDAWVRAKELYLGHFGATGMTRRYFEMYNILGDPTVEVLGLDFGIRSPSELPAAYLGEPYAYTLTASGGVEPYTWNVAAGDLPDGLALDPGTGLISGTPTVPGGETFTIQVTDAVLNTDAQECTLPVLEQLQITTPSDLPGAALNQSYSVTLDASGGTEPYTWSLLGAGQYEESDPGPGYLGGGSPTGWQADDSSWYTDLPWSFPFYGTEYDSVYVCSNGFLDFGSSAANYANSQAELASNVRIAPLWDDLRTDGGGNIFVTSTDDYVAVRWAGHTYSGSVPVDFEAVLFPNGNIQFNYGQAHSGLTPTIGVSRGNAADYTLTSLDGASSIAANVSSLLTYGGLLPEGLSLDGAAGQITGTPTEAGDFAFTCKVQDAGAPQQAAMKEFNLSVSTSPIALSLPAKVWEGQGTLTDAGTVTIAGALLYDLVVMLDSSDYSELSVPNLVSIPAGLTWAPFDLIVQDDPDYDGIQTVLVSATSAEGDTDAAMYVGDDDVHHFAIDEISSPQTVDVAFPMTIAARDVNDQTIEVYDGSVDLTGEGHSGTVPVEINPGQTPDAVADVPASPETQTVLPQELPVGAQKSLGTYHDYAELTTFLTGYEAAYPAICQLTSIGQSVQGRELWAMKISDNPGVEEDEPEVKYVSTMHGDEPVGTEMCLYFIDQLLGDYGTDPRITELVDETEIWILPLMNPDGRQAGTRGNANGIDLNRNFPEGSAVPIGNILDGPPMDTAGCQVETVRVMQWSASQSFMLSANYHTGALVVNYPYDNDGMGSVYSPSPDEALFQHLARTYSAHNAPMWNSPIFPDGITNGAQWYAINGGMQDWNYRYLGTNAVTIELSNVSWPAEATLPGFWADNQQSMLAYFEAVHMGARGVVTDSITGLPVFGSVLVAGNSHPVFTDPDVGDYHRMLLPGTYDLTFAAPGYYSQTVNDVTVVDGLVTGVDVPLVPLSAGIVFVDGQWTGQVAVGAPDTGVVLTADDGSGHTGQSNPFDVEGIVFGTDTVGFYNPTTSHWYLKNANESGASGVIDFVYDPGGSDLVPLVGDWDGDGTDTVGLYAPATSTWYLKDANDDSPGVNEFQLGSAGAGWLPITGDWDGNDTDTVGLYNPTTSHWYLKNSNSATGSDVVDFVFDSGGADMVPLAGNWDGDLIDTVGLYVPATSTWYLKDSNDDSPGVSEFQLGPAGAGWTPITGDFNSDGTDTIGLYNPTAARWYLKDSNSPGGGDVTAFRLGLPGSGWLPITGDWDGAKSALSVRDAALLAEAQRQAMARRPIGHGPDSGRTRLAGDAALLALLAEWGLS